MATCSNILAGRIPWTEESGGLQSTGLQKVRHDWSNLSQHIALPIGRHLSKHFMYAYSANPQKTCKVGVYHQFYWWENWNTESLSNLPKATQPLRQSLDSNQEVAHQPLFPAGLQFSLWQRGPGRGDRSKGGRSFSRSQGAWKGDKSVCFP